MSNTTNKEVKENGDEKNTQLPKIKVKGHIF